MVQHGERLDRKCWDRAETDKKPQLAWYWGRDRPQKSRLFLHVSCSADLLFLSDSLVESRETSLYACAQVYHAVLAAKPAASLCNPCTLSLVMHWQRAGPADVNVLLRAWAHAVWDQAKTWCASLLCKPGKPVAVHECLVLESLDADEAAGCLSDVKSDLILARHGPLHYRSSVGLS